MSPQDLTIFAHYEDNLVHHTNINDTSGARSKTNLQHLQTLNKYINANNSHSIVVPSHIWNHKIHLLHEDPPGLHLHNQSVNTKKLNQDYCQRSNHGLNNINMIT